MQSNDLQQLKLDLAQADPTNDTMFFDLLQQSFRLLQFTISDIAKAIGVSSSTVEEWIDGYATAAVPLRPWIFKFLTKQITSYGELVSYHATDEYGYRYHFDQATSGNLADLTDQLGKCSHLLNRVQLSYLPPKIRLAFFADNILYEDTSCLEELHYLIVGIGGYPEVHISGGSNATILPFSKPEKEEDRRKFTPVSFRHCYELKDGCAIKVGGRCVCKCCLLEKRALTSKVAI